MTKQHDYFGRRRGIFAAFIVQNTVFVPRLGLRLAFIFGELFLRMLCEQSCKIVHKSGARMTKIRYKINGPNLGSTRRG